MNDIEFWKSEAEANKRQMDKNAAFATRYENALWDIAKLCGWEMGAGCSGPPVDADEVATRLVKARIHGRFGLTK